MANPDHVGRLAAGVAEWNSWRQRDVNVIPDLSGADLGASDLKGIDLSRADLTRACLHSAYLRGAALTEANLTKACLQQCSLIRADLVGATLNGADLTAAFGMSADFTRATLIGADLGAAFLISANFTSANLSAAKLTSTALTGANLTGADLSGANLRGAQLIQANLSRANLTGCRIYGLSAWDVQVDGAIQLELIINPPRTPRITVDNLEIAQFIYLLLNNQKIRHVIDTITSKVVLILGRFTPERKPILDAIRDELRKRDYLPVLFDFEKPSNRDITETVSTLAHMARFVIADITDAKSIPQELMAIVPSLPSVPVQPLLLVSQREYGMFEHFMRYPWVLEPYLYEDQEGLLAAITDKVIGPAETMAKGQTGTL